MLVPWARAAPLAAGLRICRADGGFSDEGGADGSQGATRGSAEGGGLPRAASWQRRRASHGCRVPSIRALLEAAEGQRRHVSAGLGLHSASSSEVVRRLECPSNRPRVLALRAGLATDAGWTESVSFRGIRCLHQRAADGQGGVRVRAEGEVDAPLFDMLSLFCEVELWHRWTPSFGQLGLRRAGKLGEDGPLRLVYFLEANLPWPFQRRTCRFGAEAVDCMGPTEDPQQIVILLDSREASRICPGLPDQAEEGVAADLLDSGIILTPGEVAGTQGTKVQVLLTIDPHMAVPDWLLAFATMNLCLLIFLQLRRAADLARSPEFLRRSCDPAHPFYMHIRQRMAESLPSQLALAPPLRGSGQPPAGNSPPR